MEVGMAEKGTLLGEDRAAAEQLQVDYARHVDDRDGDAWAELFGSDGVLVVGQREITGHDALKTFAEGSTRGVHIQGLASFAVVDDGSVESSSSFVFVNAETLQVIAGWYHDRLVASEAGYRFARREIDIRTRR
jgi:SnoaL-like domain